MLDLYATLAGLPPEVPWVWVWGEAGAGRRQTAQAVHSQSSPGYDKLWSIAGFKLGKSDLVRFFGDLERERSSAPKLHAPSGAIETGVLACPGRFTLVVTDFRTMAPDAQLQLLDRVLKERIRVDGLRVVATVEAAATTAATAAEMSAPDAMPTADTFPQDRVRSELLQQKFTAVRVPSLRECVEDVPLLAQHFLEAASRNAGGTPCTLSEEALALLTTYSFCGGGRRELRDILEKLPRLARSSGTISVEMMRTALTPTVRFAARR